MRRAIFPGSFDPLTNGHLDIIRRSAPLFDETIVAVLNNAEKKPMFSVSERCQMLDETLPTAETAGCKMLVESFSGLTAEFAKRSGATAIVRGIRAVSDYEYELRMALMNRRLEPPIETVFLMAGEEFSYVRSVLKEGIRLNGASIDWVYRGGEFENYFCVYDCEGKPCLTCGTEIVKLTVGQRGTHICPSCQPLERKRHDP